MDKETAIKVENVSKVFKIPHEKVSSLRGAFVGALSSLHPSRRDERGQGGVSYETFEALDDIVAFSELERFIDQKLKNYSSGMSVRLAYFL